MVRMCVYACTQRETIPAVIFLCTVVAQQGLLLVAALLLCVNSEVCMQNANVVLS
jgi:hypothetical protein